MWYTNTVFKGSKASRVQKALAQAVFVGTAWVPREGLWEVEAWKYSCDGESGCWDQGAFFFFFLQCGISLVWLWAHSSPLRASTSWSLKWGNLCDSWLVGTTARVSAASPCPGQARDRSLVCIKKDCWLPIQALPWFWKPLWFQNESNDLGTLKTLTLSFPCWNSSHIS